MTDVTIRTPNGATVTVRYRLNRPTGIVKQWGHIIRGFVEGRLYGPTDLTPPIPPFTHTITVGITTEQAAQLDKAYADEKAKMDYKQACDTIQPMIVQRSTTNKER